MTRTISRLSLVLTATALIALAVAQPTETAGHPRREGMEPVHQLRTVGIYVQPPGEGQQHYYDFYKACGYNHLEFCDGGFSQKPDRLTQYYRDFAASVAEAQRRGFKVWILLLAGMKQYKGPDEIGGNAGTFSALEKDLLEERIHYIRLAVKELHLADGFQFFAGDPGGDPEGRATITDCAAFARRVQAIVHEEAPRARFAVNVWAIAEWAGFPSPFSLDFWQKQVELSRAVVHQPELVGRNCGIVFSMDNYYRSLALRCYSDAGVTPESYPQASDVEALRRRDVGPIYGWPYFLVDECDDGFITPNNVVAKGQSQAETRYIRAIVEHGRAIGLDGLIANASFVAAESLNIYCFARMCRDPKLTPGQMLDEYAGIVAEDGSKSRLSAVLRYIENHCNWQNSLPPENRLPDFDCGGLRSPADAIATLGTVVPRAKARIPLPESPADYLARLKRRLDTIAGGEIGGANPLYTPKRRHKPEETR